MEKTIFALAKSLSSLSFTPTFYRKSSEITLLPPIFSNGGSQWLFPPPFSL